MLRPAPRAAALALAAALVAFPAAAEQVVQDPAGPPIGLVVVTDLGGGGTLGRGTDSSRGLFEGELAIGYELPAGLRPELGLLVGLAGGGHVGLRPGLRYDLPGMPLYLRVALDWATARENGSWRWLLAGAGAELRLTGVLGVLAEADLGMPLANDVGVGLLVRSGVSFRF